MAPSLCLRLSAAISETNRALRLAYLRSGAGHGLFDRRQRRVSLGAVGPTGLRHVGPAAAALAAERLGALAHQLHRVETRGEIGGDADDDAGLAVFGDADDRV